MGIEGWKAFIPVYDVYLMCEYLIGAHKGWMCILTFIPIVGTIYFVFILQTVPELWLWFDVPDRFPGVKPDFYRCFRSWRLLLF